MALNIAIIGGGIGGLTAAIALRQKCHSVTLFEQAPEIGEVGAGLQISVNAVRVFQALGLKPQNWVCNKPTSITLHDYKNGDFVARVAMNTTADLPYLQFHRADLISELMQAAIAVGVTLKLGTQVSVSMNGPDSADVDGERFDLVVGADGVRSSVRGQFYDAQKPRFTGQIAWRALVSMTDLPSDFGTLSRVFMGPKKHMVTYPLRDGSLINIVAVEERNEWTDEGWVLASSSDSPDSIDSLGGILTPDGHNISIELHHLSTYSLSRIEFNWGAPVIFPQVSEPSITTEGDINIDVLLESPHWGIISAGAWYQIEVVGELGCKSIKLTTDLSFGDWGKNKGFLGPKENKKLQFTFWGTGGTAPIFLSVRDGWPMALRDYLVRVVGKNLDWPYPSR